MKKAKKFPIGSALIAAVKAEKCNLPKNVQDELARIQDVAVSEKGWTLKSLISSKRMLRYEF